MYTDIGADISVFGANKEHTPLILSYKKNIKFVLYLANQLLQRESLTLH